MLFIHAGRGDIWSLSAVDIFQEHPMEAARRIFSDLLLSRALY